MSDLPIIITRAQPGAAKTLKGLLALGLKPLLSPALTLQPDPDILVPSPEGFSGVIFTSANGARFYGERETDRTLPAWCVGPSTAAAAREVGFEEVHEGTGNATRLAALIASTIAPPPLPLLHIANAAATGDLQKELKMRRYKVKFVPLYRADTAPALEPDVIETLASGKPAIVLVHSAKGAEAFAHLSRDHSVSALTAVAISPPAARPLAQLGYAQTFVARMPNEARLMETLKEAIAALSA